MRLHRYLRNRALRLARQISTPVHDWRAARAPQTIELDTVRRRLELLLAAMYDQPIRVANSPGTNLDDVLLPSWLDASEGPDAALARYRLLAVAQGARVARGTHAAYPEGDRLARDLYKMAESAASERMIVGRAPALAPMLAEMRAAELAARPPMERLLPMEQTVERLFRAMLETRPDGMAPLLPIGGGPTISRTWAESMASDIRRAYERENLTYRGLYPRTPWGMAWSPGERHANPFRHRPSFGTKRGESGPPDPYAAPESSASDDDRSEQNEGVATESEGRHTAAGSAAATEDESFTVARETPTSDVRAPDGAGAAPPDGVQYPEWNDDERRMLSDAVTVSCSMAERGDGKWAAGVLEEHAPLVRQVRDRFAPLRARRLRLRRQRSGDALDLDACVEAITDQRLGHAPSDRLYQVDRAMRHTMATLLLVDVSGSTRAVLADGRTVLDVERMTLLLASEALATLGDPYAMLAFSGCGQHGVRVQTVKDFDEADEDAVRRRISSLAPQENTRLGAAVRHATAVLATQPVKRRVLLILSDGKPNDIYGYQGAYAIEDSRRALLDARACGVHSFCLTVDQEDREYLPHLFGANGYRVLRHPEQLPNALLAVVSGMLRE